ncbi:IS66 family insertion sequence element accessory protein TnpB, partial [Salmonella enterica subsp. enterica serovar Infantis]|nr:IS66 family insertion sequence element accessory protein TnpB [Salmonella enterica subsp. enterica serovar Infantis]
LDDSKFHGLSERLIRHHSQSNQNTGFAINQQQFNALISGLAWHNLGKEILTPVI